MSSVFVLGLILSAPPSILLAGRLVLEAPNNNDLPDSVELLPVLGPQKKPNVYVIILDAYGRSDQLEKTFGFNNSKFLNFLEDKEFFILKNSYSSYPDSTFSITSLFNMDYHKEFNPGNYDERFKTPVFRIFQKAGYRTHVLLGYRGGVCPPKTSVCLSTGSEGVGLIGILGQRLLQLTPLFEIILKYFPQLYGDTRTMVDDLRVVLASTDLSSPSFVFAHIGFPHPPFTRAETCAADIRKDVSNEENYAIESAGRYVKQLRCVNKQMRQLLDELIRKDPEAVVIIQSDHGSGFVYVQSKGDTKFNFSGSGDWRINAFNDRYGIINAWRVPADCQNKLYSTMGTVNTFRYLFTCLGIMNLDVLKNKSYWPDFATKRFFLLQTDGVLDKP
ncbi:sulfatase-like hydrolase/transferase [Rhodospirillales bacterium]|nr:sulfatase-like hydrolase/transferase [Rhodospirillales bacterium]